MICVANQFATDVAHYEDGLGILVDTLFENYSVPKNECPLWMFARMEGSVRKLANITSIYALILDYDNGVTIDQFKRDYRHLEYYWYTSKNHLKDGTTHKFRVVLPLAEEIPFSAIYTEQGQAALQAFFPGIDPSSLRNWQARPNRGEHYDCGYNVRDTVRYSLDMIKETIASRPELQTLKSRKGNSEVKGYYNPDPIEFINRVRKAQFHRLQSLPSSAGEQSYNDYTSLVSRMLAANCNGVWCWSTEEVFQHVVGHRNEKSIASLVNNFASNRPQFPPEATKPLTKTFQNLGAY